jgi:tetratricopeptide (TPR) repeat protein
MSQTTEQILVPLAVAEIERRLRWRAVPVMLFAGILAVFLVAGLWPQIVPARSVRGLPDDPDLLAAARELRGHVAFPTDELMFDSAITGLIASGARGAVDQQHRIDRAEQFVERARPRLAGDPRWIASRAALDLVRHGYASARHHYRDALRRALEYPEARLGLGATLALQAEIERHPLAQRRLRLEAIAQFAAVSPQDALYAAALYDRALLLDVVGRREEAAKLARLYLERGAREPGAKRMREIAAAG